MTDTVTIRRELLERALKADASIGATSVELVDGWKAMAELRAAIAAPVHGEAVPVEDRGWPDRDYWCKCSLCLHEFTGHKRQVICRVCSEQQDELATPPQPAEVGELQAAIECAENYSDAYSQMLDGAREELSNARELLAMAHYAGRSRRMTVAELYRIHEWLSRNP